MNLPRTDKTDGRYMTLISSAMQYNKTQHDRWNDNVRLYRGELTAFRTKALKKWQHLIEVNLTRPTIDTMLPNIIFRTPKIFVRPATEIANQQSSDMALMIENKFNAITNELNLAREVKRAVKDALLLGNGYIKYGLTTDVGYDVDTHPFAAPFIKRSSPWETWVDPATREADLDDSEYIVFRNIIPLERARADRSLDRPQRLQPTGIMQALPEHIKDDKTSRVISVYEFTTLYELWHRGEGRFLILDVNGNIYRKQEWPYDLQGMFPLSVVNFNRIPEEFYGMGEPEFLYSLQLEASEKRTQQLNHTRRFNRKYQVSSDMPKDDLDKLTEGEDGTVVVSNHEVHVIQDAPLSIDLEKEYGMIMNEAKYVTGISAYEKGQGESAVYSAEAAHIIDNASNIRIDERRDEVANMISSGSRILYNIIKESQGWPQMAFNFNVDVGTMQRPDDTGRRQELIQLGQILGKFPGFNVPAYLKDVALAFCKPPNQYLMTPQQQQEAAQQQGPNPEQQKLQIQQQQAQAQIQMAQQKMQLDAQAQQQDQQFKAQQMQADMEMQKIKGQIEIEKMQIELKIKIQEAEIEKQKSLFAMHTQHQQNLIANEDMKMKHEAMKADHHLKAGVAANQMLMEEKKHNANVQLSMQKMQNDKAGDTPDEPSGE